MQDLYNIYEKNIFSKKEFNIKKVEILYGLNGNYKLQNLEFSTLITVLCEKALIKIKNKNSKKELLLNQPDKTIFVNKNTEIEFLDVNADTKIIIQYLE